MNTNHHQLEQGIACQQVLLHDSSVFSIQWLVVPHRHAHPLSSRFLLERYLSHIRSATLSLIRPRVADSGIEFRLLDTAVSLISFRPALYRQGEGGEEVRLFICGGLLVQPAQCHRGQLTFSCERLPDGVKATLELADYCPLLLGSPTPSLFRKWLYRFTQAAIHKLVTVRFLARIYRELAGKSACVRVRSVTVREGEEI